jgi:hypothetical protein
MGISVRVFAISAVAAFVFALLAISTVGDPQELLFQRERSPMALFPAEGPDDGPLLGGLRRDKTFV